MSDERFNEQRKEAERTFQTRPPSTSTAASGIRLYSTEQPTLYERAELAIMYMHKLDALIIEEKNLSQIGRGPKEKRAHAARLVMLAEAKRYLEIAGFRSKESLVGDHTLTKQDLLAFTGQLMRHVVTKKFNHDSQRRYYMERAAYYLRQYFYARWPKSPFHGYRRKPKLQ